MKKTMRLDNLLEKPTLLDKFHENTKIKRLPKNEKDPNYWPKEWKTIYYKGYERLDDLLLPKPQLPANISFKKVITERKSERDFSKKPLSLDKLSTLLYYSAGINDLDEDNKRRFYPSPGARYTLEVYLLSDNISEVAKGLYHYYLKDHSLEELVLLKEIKYRNFFNQFWIKQSAAIIVITAILGRNTIKYGERGYRHVLVEAGHMAHNLYLMSSALNISCCAIGGYIDDNLNKLLDIDGKNETVIYVLAIGEKP